MHVIVNSFFLQNILHIVQWTVKSYFSDLSQYFKIFGLSLPLALLYQR